MLDCGYGLPVVLWVCGGCEFLCDGGGSVGCRFCCWRGVWSMGVAVWVGHVWLRKCGEKKMGMAVWVAGMSVGKAWEKKLIF